MEARNPKQAKERMIHVRLPEAMHKKVRIRAAETDQTIQDWVFADVRNVAHQRLAPILLSGGQTTGVFVQFVELHKCQNCWGALR